MGMIRVLIRVALLWPMLAAQSWGMQPHSDSVGTMVLQPGRADVTLYETVAKPTLTPISVIRVQSTRNTK